MGKVIGCLLAGICAVILFFFGRKYNLVSVPKCVWQKIKDKRSDKEIANYEVKEDENVSE
jgi:hypothetical protein